MPWIDSRVPVMIGSLEQAGSHDALLFERHVPPDTAQAALFTPQNDHPAGCTCCVSRTPAARALTRLLHDRARGKTTYFQRVLVVTASPEGRAEVTEALRTDPVVSACFRPAA